MNDKPKANPRPKIGKLDILLFALVLIGLLGMAYAFFGTSDHALLIPFLLITFIGVIGSSINAVRRNMGMTRLYYMCQAINLIASLAIIMAQSSSMSSDLKTTITIFGLIIYVVSVLLAIPISILRQRDSHRSSSQQNQLDIPKANPFYTEQVKPDKVK